MQRANEDVVSPPSWGMENSGVETLVEDLAQSVYPIDQQLAHRTDCWKLLHSRAMFPPTPSQPSTADTECVQLVQVSTTSARCWPSSQRREFSTFRCANLTHAESREASCVGTPAGAHGGSGPVPVRPAHGLREPGAAAAARAHDGAARLRTAAAGARPCSGGSGAFGNRALILDTLLIKARLFWADMSLTMPSHAARLPAVFPCQIVLASSPTLHITRPASA